MAAIPQDVISFWRNAGPAKWFKRSDAFDQAVRLRFEPVHHAAARGEYDHWVADAEGSLALVILLDQVPRNIFRGSAHAFATDPKARTIARAAIAEDHDRQVDDQMRQFFYLPFEHSEDPADQAFCLRLFEADAPNSKEADPMKWARLHFEIIQRFGRFPHRNAVFGRRTTPEEQAFLDDGGFAG